MYVIQCKYIGKTSRRWFERYLKHWKDYKCLSRKSPILKHYVGAYMNMKLGDLTLTVQMRVIERYRSAFERKIDESVHLYSNLKKGVNLLKSKTGGVESRLMYRESCWRSLI